MMAPLLLFLPVFAFLALLLWPSFSEWRWPKDAAAIPVDPSYFRNDYHFPERFRQIAQNWWDSPEDCLREDEASMEPDVHVSVPILATSLYAKAHGQFDQEIWTRNAATFEPHCRLRALLSEGPLVLGNHCAVTRWVHSEDWISSGAGVDLGYRATSRSGITLSYGCRARLLAAEEIIWLGSSTALPLGEPADARVWGTQEKLIQHEGTAFLDGNVILESNAHLPFPLVVRGHLYIRPGAIISGDIKAHGNLVIAQATVVGNIVAEGDIYIGSGSTVQGCILSQKLLWLGDDVRLGQSDRKVAIVGDRVLLAGRGQAHGRIKSLKGQIEVLS